MNNVAPYTLKPNMEVLFGSPDKQNSQLEHESFTKRILEFMTKDTENDASSPNFREDADNFENVYCMRHPKRENTHFATESKVMICEKCAEKCDAVSLVELVNQVRSELYST